jgi:Flp pilus assembly protein TadG
MKRRRIAQCLGTRAGAHTKLIEERKAAAAVEIAMIGAPLFLILEIFQSALFVYESGMLNHATQSAARQVMVGSVQNGGSNRGAVQNQFAMPAAPRAMPCSNVVNLQAFSETSGFYNFVNSTQTAPRLSVRFGCPLSRRRFRDKRSNSSRPPLKNEPYQSSYTPPARC